MPERKTYRVTRTVVQDVHATNDVDALNSTDLEPSEAAVRASTAAGANVVARRTVSVTVDDVTPNTLAWLNR